MVGAKSTSEDLRSFFSWFPGGSGWIRSNHLFWFGLPSINPQTVYKWKKLKTSLTLPGGIQVIWGSPDKSFLTMDYIDNFTNRTTWFIDCWINIWWIDEAKINIY